jgi:hypothetical protein
MLERHSMHQLVCIAAYAVPEVEAAHDLWTVAISLLVASDRDVATLLLLLLLLLLQVLTWGGRWP